MFLARVIGSVVSPVQHPALEGERLLLLRRLKPDGTPAGSTRIALDRAGAGPGEWVLVVDEGNAGRQLVERPDAPVKTVIVAVVDHVDAHGRRLYDASGPDQEPAGRA